MAFTYKNITERELVIPQVGTIKPGETITSENKLENQNLEEVKSTTSPINTTKEETK